MMKKFMLALTLCATLAQAEEVKVGMLQTESYYDKAEAKFVANPELGRAWIEVELSKTFGMYDEVYTGDSTTRLKVAGLSYDKNTNGVIYTNGATTVACANSKKAMSKKLRLTKKCDFVIKDESVKVDDGFEIYSVPYKAIYLSF